MIEIVASRPHAPPPPPSIPRLPVDRPSDPARPSESTLPSAHVQQALRESRQYAGLLGERDALARRIGLPDLREDQEPFFQVFHLLVGWLLGELVVLGAPLPLVALGFRRILDGRYAAGAIVGVSAGAAFVVAVATWKGWSRARRVLHDYRRHHALCREIHAHERALERGMP